MRCKGFLSSVALLASGSIADIAPLYRSRPYDIGAYDRWPHQLYHSSSAIGPILNYHDKSEECMDDGLYTVVPYWGKQVNIPGVMLLDSEGYLVWHNTGYVTGDIQSFGGEDYIVALAMDSTHYALVSLMLVSHEVISNIFIRSTRAMKRFIRSELEMDGILTRMN